ncbi:unnamed protein product [Phaeothamnion confervicola]
MELEAARAMMEEQEQVRRAAASASGGGPSHSFNKKGIDAKLREMARDLPWEETLVVCEHPLELEDVHDDLQREVAFYNNALATVQDAKGRLAKLGIPYRRPDDFLCEMVKSDQHMAKIKDKLIFEQKKMEAFEQRKQRQDQRKYAKQVSAAKATERTARKKETLDAIDQWRKTAKSRGGGPLPDNDGLDDYLNANGKRGRTDGGGGGPLSTKKRAAADRKYGFGGPTRYKKSTDSKSLNDFSSFDPKKGKLVRKKGSRPNKGASRPGKSARQRGRGK